MKSSVGEPRVEILESSRIDDGCRVVCRFSEAYSDPVAPGAFYEKPASAEDVFRVHRVADRVGLVFTFETFGTDLPLLPSGRSLFYRGWWTKAAMRAALDVNCNWERMAYPNDGTHEHCLFTWAAIAADEGERVGYFSKTHGWVAERAYMDFVVRDIYRLREAT